MVICGWWRSATILLCRATKFRLQAVWAIAFVQFNLIQKLSEINNCGMWISLHLRCSILYKNLLFPLYMNCQSTHCKQWWMNSNCIHWSIQLSLMVEIGRFDQWININELLLHHTPELHNLSNDLVHLNHLDTESTPTYI